MKEIDCKKQRCFFPASKVETRCEKKVDGKNK